MVAFPLASSQWRQRPPEESPAGSRCSLAVAAGTPLFGHGRQHLADVGGQEVVHLVALPG